MLSLSNLVTSASSSTGTLVASGRFYELKPHSLQAGYELVSRKLALQVTPGLTFSESIIASQISSLTLVEGGPSMHVTVGDQSGNPITPSNIAWAAASELTLTADATGVNCG